MLSLQEAVNIAYEFSRMPVAYAIWETPSKYLLFMVPKDTDISQKLDMGSTLIAISKETKYGFIYDIFDHLDEFVNAKRIESGK